MSLSLREAVFEIYKCQIFISFLMPPSLLLCWKDCQRANELIWCGNIWITQWLILHTFIKEPKTFIFSFIHYSFLIFSLEKKEKKNYWLQVIGLNHWGNKKCICRGWEVCCWEASLEDKLFLDILRLIFLIEVQVHWSSNNMHLSLLKWRIHFHHFSAYVKSSKEH